MQYDYGLRGSPLMKLDLYVNVHSVLNTRNKSKMSEFLKQIAAKELQKSGRGKC